ncbi:hypothetical protein EG68_04010 [Paragonimus skrjabini miyazakii]|uniref:Cell division cycle protein 123 homolog n=1 Tax=Paragonimus skrjabini miyazakii TaxID=59628 RepID=A0A8S9Z065_9TREM|nr:hypothetical protein EG68_04010 [Paragonimus skrjabini miyazakii]
MLVNDVKACSFDAWYNNFRDFTSESFILPLSPDFVDSILEDHIMLPKTAPVFKSNKSNPSDSDDNWSECDEENESGPRRPEFPEFEAELLCAIRKLGGAVFPKLNWSAPKVCFSFRYLIHSQDASWMLCGNSLKYFVAHDLTAPFALCADVPVEQLKEKQDFQPVLVLRRWSDYRPDGEFRCFVRARKLIAISQRMHDSYFQSVAQNVEHIKQELHTFFNKRIRDRFPLNDYTVDLYYEPSNSPNRRSKIILIDFNVFGLPTEPLLFTWSELEDNNLIERVSDPVIRVQTDRSIRPNVFSQYSVPIDLIDIASGSDPSKLMEFVQTCIEEQQEN